MPAITHICTLVLANTETDYKLVGAGQGATKKDAMEDAFDSLHTVDKHNAIRTFMAAIGPQNYDVSTLLERLFFDTAVTEYALVELSMLPTMVVHSFYNTVE